MPPTAFDAALRTIPFEGPCNFRDLGGLPSRSGTIRTGLLYRSDALHTATDGDIDVIREQLGVTRVLDLRSSAELDEDGIGLVRDRFAHQHVPIFEQNSSLWDGREVRLIELYRHMIDDGAAQLVAALRIVAAAGSPTVFHCTAGKDRTGVLAALILSLVDVGDDQICADYARTATALPIIRARFEQRTAGARFAAVNGGDQDEARMSAMADELLSARSETMHELLAFVRREHGGVPAWAERNGFTASEIDHLRTTLVA